MMKLLSKRQTADYSDGEAILTLVQYDRTALFVPQWWFSSRQLDPFPKESVAPPHARSHARCPWETPIHSAPPPEALPVITWG